MRIGIYGHRPFPTTCLLNCLFPVLLLIAFCVSAFSQDTKDGQANFLLGVIFKLETMHDAAVQEIGQLENEIRKADATIAKAEKIIQLARDRGNSEAEATAQGLLATTREIRSKNIDSKTTLEGKLRQIDLALATVRNKLAGSLGRSERIESMVSNFTGRVSVQKKGERPYDIDPGRPVFLEKGDVVTTYGKSSVEMQFLEGRGTLKLGEYSRVEMAEDTGADIQAINLVQGAVNIGVEKLDIYDKALGKKIEAYEADLKTVKDEVKQKIVNVYRAKLEKIRKKFEVRTPSFAMSIRATRFIVRLDGAERSEVIMLEGSVEVKPVNAAKRFVVEAGYKTVFSADGIFSGPEKIDPSKFEMR